MRPRSPLPLRKVTIRLDERDWAVITAAHKEGEGANAVARALLHGYAEVLRSQGHTEDGKVSKSQTSPLDIDLAAL